MLQNSKSIYFLKRLFTLLDEKTKLDIIKYNKNMQNILDISLINYKIFSGRYIIYGTNGIGCEYDAKTDQCIFEGEYSNGERNGKGKEYGKFFKLIFKGEFLNGKRNGKGKEYYDDNNTFYFSDKNFNNDEDSNEESSDKSSEEIKI